MTKAKQAKEKAKAKALAAEEAKARSKALAQEASEKRKASALAAKVARLEAKQRQAAELKEFRKSAAAEEEKLRAELDAEVRTKAHGKAAVTKKPVSKPQPDRLGTPLLEPGVDPMSGLDGKGKVLTDGPHVYHERLD